MAGAITYDEQPQDLWPIEAYLRAFDGAEWIGTIQWRTDTGEISWVQVDQPYQRRGIASELLRRAREHEPRLHHSQNRTEEGEAWVQHVGGAQGDLPDLTFGTMHPSEGPVQRVDTRGPNIKAEVDGRYAGHIYWDKDTGEVTDIYVVDDFRRRGVGTALWEEAQRRDPRVQHSRTQTSDGEAWSKSLGKVASPEDDERAWIEVEIHAQDARKLSGTEFEAFCHQVLKAELGRRIKVEFDLLYAPSLNDGILAEAVWMDDGNYAYIGWSVYALNTAVALHECAHVIAGYRGNDDGHGPHWRSIYEGLRTKHTGSKTAGPLSDVIPDRFRSRTPLKPHQVDDPRKVVFDRPAQEDLAEIPAVMRKRTHDALQQVEDGRLVPEPKVGDLEGVYTIRLSPKWRAAMYLGADGAWHVFAINDHNYDEVERRWLGRDAARQAVTVDKWLYHVAPRSARASINQHGLDPSHGKSPWSSYSWIRYPKGIYLFDNQDDALTYIRGFQRSYLSGDFERDWDIWQVYPFGLDLQPDPLMQRASDHPFKGKAYLVTEPISADALGLAWTGKQAATWDGEHWDDTEHRESIPLYHVAPTSARESIERHGLDHTKGNQGRRWGDVEYPQGTYFFRTLDGPESARAFQSIWSKHFGHDFDIWEVQPGLTVRRDPLFFGQTRFTEKPVPRSKIKRVAMPSWRDRGMLPSADAVIAPDQGRSSRNSFAVYTYGEMVGRRRTLAEAKALVEEVYGPQRWVRADPDPTPHVDRVWGPTKEFNDAPRYWIVETLPRLGTTASRRYYHISGVSNRASIEEHGLRAGDHGVWLYSDPERVRGVGKVWTPGHPFEEQDVWLVEPGEVVHGTQARDRTSAEEHYPDDPVWVTYADVPPSRVHRVDNHTLTVVGVLGTRLWWRVHPAHREFMPETATSIPFFPEEGERPQPGFSAFDDPWHLWFYIWMMWGWRGQRDNDVIGFSGTRVGTGHDGEDLVMPTGGTVQRYSQAEFFRELVATPFPASPVFSREYARYVDYNYSTWERLAKVLAYRDSGDPVEEHIVRTFAGQVAASKTAADEVEIEVKESGPLQLGDYTVVARINGEIVGRLSGGKFNLVDKIYVLPAHRRKGIATKMLRALQEKVPNARMPDEFSDSGAAWFSAINPGGREYYSTWGTDPNWSGWMRNAKVAYGPDLIARGLRLVVDNLSLAKKFESGTVTANDIVRALMAAGGLGVWWGVMGSFGNIEDFEDYAWGEDSESLKTLLEEYHEDPQRYGYIGGQVQVVLVAKRPTRDGVPWDPEIHNPLNPLMGNSFLDDGEQVELVEIRYDAGWGWKSLPARGIRARASIGYSWSHGSQDQGGRGRDHASAAAYPPGRSDGRGGGSALPRDRRLADLAPLVRALRSGGGSARVAARYTVHVQGQARYGYMQVPPADRAQVNRAVRGLWNWQGNIRQVAGRPGWYRLRTGNWRIFFSREGNHIEVFAVVRKSERTYRTGAGPKVPGLRLTYEDMPGGGGRVIAWDDDNDAAWQKQYGIGMLSWNAQGQISWVQVYEDEYQRRGVASAMFEEAKRHKRNLHHSDELSESGRAWSEKVAWQQSQTRPTVDTYRMSGQVRAAAKVLSLQEATALIRRVLTDAGFPQGDEARAEWHPSGYGKSSVAWDMELADAGIIIPIVALGGGMNDELTTLHECAHIIRNGPRYRGVQSDKVISHDDQWFNTWARLMSWYATDKCWRQFQFVFGEKSRAGPLMPGVRIRSAWQPFRPPAHITISSGGDAVPGGYNGYYVAYDKATGRKMGYLDYQSAREVEETEFGTPVTTEHVTIAMVEVEPEFRRQGVATVLLQALRHDFPDAEIDPGYQTPEGGAWWRSVGRTAAQNLSLRFEHLRGRGAAGDGTFEPMDRIDTLVAYDGSKAVGWISWMTSGDWTKGSVDALGVDEAYQRRGIATELLRRAQQIEPEVDPHNTPWFTDEGLAWLRSLSARTANMADPRVQEAVNEFLDRPNLPGLNPWDAHDQCYNESQRFERLLKSKGVQAEVVMGYKTDEFMGQRVITQGHVGVRVGNTVYDWTARQFDPQAPVPRVVTLAEWQREWPEIGKATSAKQAALSGGTIYRGLRADLPPDVDAQVRDLLAPEMDEESYARWKPYGGKKVQAGELIVRALEKSHWDSEMGLGRHWSENRDIARIGAQQGGRGDWPILLTATYTADDVDPEFDSDAPFMQAESEVRLRPGAQITVTQVDILRDPGGIFSSKGQRVSYQPIQARASKAARLTLYRGEGTHERKSYYPTTGPDAWMAGAWWTSDLDKAWQYAKSTQDGKVYVIEVDESEAKQSGAPNNYLIRDPEVRKRRRLHTEASQGGLERYYGAVRPARLWHVTRSRDFVPDPEHKPQGSNFEQGVYGPGLFLTPNPELWRYLWAVQEYGTTPVYAAEIDVSALSDRECYQVGMPDRDQWFVSGPAVSKVKVLRTVPSATAEKEARRQGYGFAMLAYDTVERGRVEIVDHRKGWGSPYALCGRVTDGNPIKWTTVREVVTGPLARHVCDECLAKVKRQVRVSSRQAAERLILYRGEGSHDRPSFYTQMGKPELAGAFWTSDRERAERYADSVEGGKVYKIEVFEGEYEGPFNGTNYLVKDPGVRKRRVEASTAKTSAGQIQHQQGTPLNYGGKFSGRPERLFITEPGYQGRGGGNFEGSPEDLVAYLDYSVVGDKVYVWFLTSRDDRKRQGLAGRLVADLYRRYPGKTVVWGELMHSGAEMLYKRFLQSHPDQTDGGWVYGRWLTGNPPPTKAQRELLERLRKNRQPA